MGETYRRYSSEDREQAVSRAREIGVRAAGRELNIPYANITRWLVHSVPAAEMGAGSGEVAGSVPAGATPASGVAGAPLPVRQKPGKRVAKAYTPSQRARVLECTAAEGVTVAARKHGVSRFTIYEWQRKVALHARGEAAESPLVGSDESRAADRDQRILSEWRAHSGLGPSQIRNQLRWQGLKVSLHTVRCVLEANGYVPPAYSAQSEQPIRSMANAESARWRTPFPLDGER